MSFRASPLYTYAKVSTAIAFGDYGQLLQEVIFKWWVPDLSVDRKDLLASSTIWQREVEFSVESPWAT
jgi:hypothetical protein